MNVIGWQKKLKNSFYKSFCLSKMSDQIILGIVRFCSWLINCNNRHLRYSITIEQSSLGEKSLKWRKMVSRHNVQQSCLQYSMIVLHLYDKLDERLFLAFRSGFLPKSWGFEPGKRTDNFCYWSLNLKFKKSIGRTTISLIRWSFCLWLNIERGVLGLL